MGVTQILDTGKQALLAQQKAIHIAGHNISNVNTPGYSRERPRFAPVESSGSGILQFGVSVDEVTRVFDHFVMNQVNTAATNFSSSRTQSELLGQVEALFNDLSSDDAGLAGSIELFFDAFQNLSNNPQGLSERNLALSSGSNVADTFQRFTSALDTVQTDVNKTLKHEISQVNVITEEISKLNFEISRLETVPHNNANTLRDERELLLKQLSEKVNITSFETKDGTVTVLLGGSRPLIEGNVANKLVAVADPDKPHASTIQMQNRQDVLTDVTSRVTGGKLHGFIQFRDTSLAQTMKNIDRLAAQLTGAVNQTHAAGYGLDESTGNLFFNARQVSAQALNNNLGGGVLQNVAVFDPSQLTLDDYQLTFASGSPTPMFDIVNTTSGATVISGQAYTAGAAIYFDGIELTLNDTGVPPSQGDIFTFSTTQNAAKNIGIASNLLDNPAKIAAAQTLMQGDNSNALALAGLRNEPLLDGRTVSDFYHTMVVSIGLEAQKTTALTEHHQLVLNETENQRESISGVSLDEEQLDLIRFQQAFEAAARLIQVADAMTDTVVNLIQ